VGGSGVNDRLHLVERDRLGAIDVFEPPRDPNTLIQSAPACTQQP
jgi:hypothetical protein